jgi:hypothetical protein
MDKPETKANEKWTSQRQRQMKNGQTRDKANEEWTNERQRQMWNGQARDKGK